MKLDFCGIGNACIDIVARIDDSFLQQWDFPKSICTYIKLDRANALEAALPLPSYIPGGCAANTAAMIAALGGSAAFIGRIAADAVGARFLDDMTTRKIRYSGVPDSSEGAGSTRIFALTTDDAERTFAAYYGVQEDLSEKDLDDMAIRQAKFLYLDGYALNSHRGGETFLTAAQIARNAGRSVVFTPSDLSILNKYSAIVNALISVTDVILCNEQEARVLTQAESFADAIKCLQGMFQSGAVTAGDRGVYVFDQAAVHNVPAAVPPGAVIDTNGAGDAFAGGFLFGLARDYSLIAAGALGNRCAAAIITQTGARPALNCTSFVTQ